MNLFPWNGVSTWTEDSAEVKHMEEEKQKIKMEKHMLEQEMEKQERMKEMEQKREEIKQVEWLLTAQRLSLLEAERGMDGVAIATLTTTLEANLLCANKWYV